MMMGAYCLGKVHNMLPWWYNDIRSILSVNSVVL